MRTLRIDCASGTEATPRLAPGRGPGPRVWRRDVALSQARALTRRVLVQNPHHPGRRPGRLGLAEECPRRRPKAEAFGGPRGAGGCDHSMV